MADRKPVTNSYRLLSGVNEKASDYSVEKAFFLSLRNVDFDVPNALQKRPGSTQAISVGTSGPIRSLFEFEKLTGESYVIAGSDTAMFLIASAAYTLLDTGWNNGQPQDMLAFVNRLWIADGGRFKSWNGSTMYQAGLPCSTGSTLFNSNLNNGASFMLVGGATAAMVVSAGGTYIVRGVFLAYSYLRSDGYMGPCDLTKAKNIVASHDVASEGAEYFTSHTKVYGFTVPPNQGITAIALWVGVDTVTNTSPKQFIANNYQNARAGDLGYQFPLLETPGSKMGMGLTLKPDADLARFHLFSLIPISNLFVGATFGSTYYATTFTSFDFNSYTGIATGSNAFTGMGFCWFDTYTPKYIDINQNVMFLAGFSGAPSTVWYSEIGQPENIEPEYNFEVRTNDGDRITANKAYQSTELIMKERSFHKVVGDSPDNFQLVELSTQYGCISNKTVIEFKEKLLWLDRQGILEYNGSAWNIISDPIEDTFRRMNLSAAREKACAAHWASRNQVWFGIPVDGSTENNLTVVYDYLVNGWTFFDGFNASAFAMIKAGGTAPTMWRGSNSGMVYYYGSSFYGDNGAGITCLGLTPFDKAQENETWMWRRLFLDVAPASGTTGVINLKFFSDYNRTSVRATFAMYQSAFQSRAEVGVDGKAVAAEFTHVSASLPLLINGYGWAKRFIRNV